jgi:CHASE2 domain-containing sensor protein/tRNA A-37 threonylcarbamoyl transferase component Bud32
MRLFSQAHQLSRLRKVATAIPPILVASVAVCGLVIGVRQLGRLEGLELNYFDRFTQLRSDEGADPRLLVVAVTQDDIQALDRWPASDQTLDGLLQKLNQYRPRVIGLDIYRDLPVEPGNAELTTRLQVNDNIIAVCKVGDDKGLGVSPPAVVPKYRLGFSDLVLDRDGVVRRGLLFMTPEKTSKCPATTSFSLQLALKYLSQQGIQAQLTPEKNLKIGKATFAAIANNSSGYQNIDARGYQVLINYRSPTAVARQVSLTDVLSDSINPEWVEDKIVLVGVTATEIKDYFYTPYDLSQQPETKGKMAGVLVHAQILSQLLSTALDGRSLFWYWSDATEILWIWVWSILGGAIAWYVRPSWLLGVIGACTLLGLGSICFVFFLYNGWIPLVPAALGLVGTSTAIVAYLAYFKARHKGAKTHEPATEESFSFTTAATTTRSKRPILKERYQIVRNIGAGGFGHTYLAEDTQRPGKPYCVVKHLIPSTDERYMQLARRLFQSEAEALETLGSFDRIPQLLAYFEQDRQFYLVEEFIQGHPLSEELVPGRRLSDLEVVALLKDILTVLDFIHRRNVIHRDIKPSNIIRRQLDNSLVLVDFGSVKQLQTQITMAQEKYTVAIGTMGYAAPEQFFGKPVFSSDIYALGTIGIQAVTGVPPTELEEDPTTHEVIWRHHVPKVNETLVAILNKMVRYYPSNRFQSATAVMKALESVMY